jgi:hypothetical protein
MANQPSLHDPEVQRQTVSMGAAAVPYLVELLMNDPAEEFCSLAIRLLGEIGPPAVEAVPELCNKLTNGQYERDACATLAKIGSEDSIPALVELLRQGSESAAMALEKIGSDRAIRALCDAVGNY